MSLHHERRRRLLAEDHESVAPIRISAAGEAGAPAIPAYTADAHAARSRAAAALVPLSRLAIGGTIVLALTLVGGLIALDVFANDVAAAAGEPAAVALRLRARGSIDRWLASSLLGAAALTAVFIFSLRRHRSDDYHARYRVWLWMAAAAIGTSLLESSGLVALLRAGCGMAASWAHLRGDFVWPATIATFSAGIGLRLLFEVRRSKTTVAAALLATGLFLAATLTHYGWPLAFGGELAPLVSRGTWLVGYVLVMTTFLLYARFVELEITGGVTLPARRKRRKAKPAEEAAPASARRKSSLKLRTDLDPIETTPAAEESQEPAKTVEMPKPSAGGMNRAERRRMKKQRMAG